MRLDIFILLLIVAIFLYRWSQKPSAVKEDDEPSEHESMSTEMVLDPNCSTYVPETEAVKVTIAGRNYCFCSEKCAEEYRQKKSTD